MKTNPGYHINTVSNYDIALYDICHFFALFLEPAASSISVFMRIGLLNFNKNLESTVFFSKSFKRKILEPAIITIVRYHQINKTVHNQHKNSTIYERRRVER